MTRSCDIPTLNTLDRDRFVGMLGAIFEHSPWVAERAWDGRPFADVAHLHAAMVAVARQASRGEQLALLRAHPELAGQAAQAGELTESSRGEQVGAGLDALTREELERITRLNAAYRDRFGFPFIIAVGHHTKHGILAELERRLANDPETERNLGLEQVYTIARLRLNKLLDRT